jgi:peptidase M23-like protein
MSHRASVWLLFIATAVLAWAVPQPVTATRPPFKLPFPCGEAYQGTTYNGHGWAIDFNQTSNGDAGDPVIASAAGTVSDTSWATRNGEITLKHGGGWKTQYAHMSGIAVKLDERVVAGQLLGYVDDIGWATGEHLHYAQIRDGVVVRSRFDGVRYDYGTSIKSSNCDKTAPDATAPDPGFRRRTKITASGAVPLRVRWTASDDQSGIKTVVLQRDVDGMGYERILRTDGQVSSFTSHLDPDGQTHVTDRLRVTDHAGNVVAYAVGPTIRLRAFDDSTSLLSVDSSRSGWDTVSDRDHYFGGTVLRSSTAGDSVSLTREGHDFAIVATRGPDKGRFAVYSDGIRAGVVDLYSERTANRQIVWRTGFAKSETRTVRLRVLAERNAASTGRTVEVDAFLVLRP